MNAIAINELHAFLLERLSSTALAKIEMNVIGESGLSVKVDGERCLTSIGVWPNGYCDVDYLETSSERGQFKHFEFQSAEAAVEPVLQEIQAAVERA